MSNIQNLKYFKTMSYSKRTCLPSTLNHCESNGRAEINFKIDFNFWKTMKIWWRKICTLAKGEVNVGKKKRKKWFTFQ